MTQNENKGMDDGEIELCDPVLVLNSSTANSNGTLQRGSETVESILDELLRNSRTCTHTHTCNPPGPDAEHTHTCYHTHTRVFSSEEDTKSRCDDPSLKPRRPMGNREAVRKYREKKKAHTAFLEEEVKKLRLLNQHLVRKVQGQGALEAEILRLRALLVDLRGKIDVELGSFPFQKSCNSNSNMSFKEGHLGAQPVNGKAISIQCPTEICFGPSNCSIVADNPVFCWRENRPPAAADCRAGENGLAGGSEHSPQSVETLVSRKNQGQ